MNPILFLAILVSFAFTLLMMPKWIKKCRQVGLMWVDMNKYGKPRNVAASGGVIVVLSFILGVLVYIAIRTFIIKDADGIDLQIFSLLSVILILAIIGLTDDLLGWNHGGLSRRFRVFLAIFASIPLVVINAGDHLINIPFFGAVNLGLFYTLVVVPIGIVAAATTFNFLAGFNGLESGQGIIILSYFSFIAWFTGNPYLGIVGLCMVASLIGFYLYNKVPAKVFPGDILTWSVGALAAGMAILGNFEKIAVFVFIPYMIELVLKLRGGLKKSSFGIPQKDGSLKMQFDKIYGLTHLSIFVLSKFKKKVYEKDVIYLIFTFQLFIILLSLLLL